MDLQVGKALQHHCNRLMACILSCINKTMIAKSKVFTPISINMNSNTALAWMLYLRRWRNFVGKDRVTIAKESMHWVCNSFSHVVIWWQRGTLLLQMSFPYWIPIQTLIWDFCCRWHGYTRWRLRFVFWPSIYVAITFKYKSFHFDWKPLKTISRNNFKLRISITNSWIFFKEICFNFVLQSSTSHNCSCQFLLYSWNRNLTILCSNFYCNRGW